MKQLVAWHAYYRISPFGEERGDLRIAQLAAFIGNLLTGKRGKRYKPMDFMPYAQPQVPKARKPMTKKKWDSFKGMFRSLLSG